MSDVLYDVPTEGYDYNGTYADSSQGALLAKEALWSELRVRQSDVGSGTTGDLLPPKECLDAEYGNVLEGLEQSSEASSELMSAQVHLIFLSMAEVTAFVRPLIERVEELAELANEEEDQQALSPLSLRGFLRFLYLHRARVATRPQLILTTDGLLRAIWRRSRDHRIGVRFLDDKIVSFVTFLPDTVRPTQINRVGGECSIEGFFRCVSVDRLGE